MDYCYNFAAGKHEIHYECGIAAVARLTDKRPLRFVLRSQMVRYNEDLTFLVYRIVLPLYMETLSRKLDLLLKILANVYVGPRMSFIGSELL